MDSKKRFGRPPAPPETVRSHRLVTFVTGSELDAIKTIANEMGESMSRVCHRLILKSLHSRPNANALVRLSYKSKIED